MHLQSRHFHSRMSKDSSPLPPPHLRSAMPWNGGLPPTFVPALTPPVYVPVTPPKMAQGVVRDAWLEMWMQRNRDADQSTASGAQQASPQFSWRTADVKARLREVAVLLDTIKHATEPQDISAKEAALAQLMSVFEDEEAYTRFKNRTLKTQRNKRWQKRKKEKRRQEQAAAPSKAEIERTAEEIRARQEAIHLAEVAARKKQVADRIEGRQKRKRARELDYKAQIAARLEVLLRIRRLKQGVTEPITYFEEVKRAQDEKKERRQADAEEQGKGEGETVRADAHGKSVGEEAPVVASVASPSRKQEEEYDIEVEGGRGVRPAKEKGKELGDTNRRKRKKRKTEVAAASPAPAKANYAPTYKQQASRSPEELEAIRQGWDSCIVPEGTPGASAIPPDLLLAARPSSLEWERLLRPPHHRR
ncbi:uncharacterized protein ACA1_400310 [Acanthamoeba castellanii str. Neff]|uniref:Uncharacterized protein n=1 Tax=Acanthamoeba castellanii (strain ATCC 30010 / Neff) TaxID=1257118 RepID=L8GFV1_ACACF|nr:uncharacterized protein ACA1_400310 [Acanthamoeba castellanii str. Neff]ELR11965.1 hypothetical protein ACA1_400310 [Acanthamoeba castellanii str. Neff]